ncbi:MAG: helix-turn-helix transcriptional regulator [Elusimicrobia bacterium]|nr:helix-turn-helix transcriptional regulator [Elusimicrobiota bacterium]
MGERAELHPSYIGQIERGTKKISLLTLQKLSYALKIKISDLLEEKNIVYKPGTWEQKLAGIVRDKPADQQNMAYRLVKETFKSLPKRK